MEVMKDIGHFICLMREHPSCTVVEDMRDGASVLVMRSLDMDDARLCEMLGGFVLDLIEEIE